MPEYWNWRIYQWWAYRQYKRADRKAFRRECAAALATSDDEEAAKPVTHRDDEFWDSPQAT